MKKAFIKKIASPGILGIQLVLLYLSNAIFFLLSYIVRFPKYTFVIGVHEVAKNIYHLGKILPNAATVCLSRDTYFPQISYSYQSTNKVVNLLYGPIMLAYLSQKSSNFFYIWSSGFLIDRAYEFRFLKRKKKKIILFFCGDDIRSPKITKAYYDAQQKDTFINYYKEVYPFFFTDAYERQKQKIAADADMYADVIFNSPFDQRGYITKKTYPIFYMIPLEEYSFDAHKHRTMQKPIIVHAPSSSLTKGTPLVRAAIKRLQQEGYEFEYIEIMNKSNDEVKALLLNSHIVLNQFYADAPGFFGIEALATHNAVLMSADPEYNTADLPADAKGAWMVTNYWQVYDHLKYLLEHPQEISVYAQKGRLLVETYFDISAAKKRYYTALTKEGITV